MNDETVVHGPARPEGRLARWLKLKLDEPFALGPVKRVDAWALWFALTASLVAGIFWFAELDGLKMMVGGLPNVLRDGPALNRFVMWLCAAIFVMGVAGLTACFAYKVYRWTKARRRLKRKAQGPGE